ncbi:hypothetical protein A5678_24685 [Mycobacterium sp. E2733]|nr:hypothetical protein A5678_24685 [Mycobacterium sp. E2733]
MDAPGPFDFASVMADAPRKEALTDWGPGEFEGPLRVLLADGRPREAARPAYALPAYGLRPEQVDERFRLYNKRFGHYIGGTAHA